jgi:hypothetical protein
MYCPVPLPNAWNLTRVSGRVALRCWIGFAALFCGLWWTENAQAGCGDYVIIGTHSHSSRVNGVAVGSGGASESGLLVRYGVVGNVRRFQSPPIAQQELLRSKSRSGQQPCDGPECQGQVPISLPSSPGLEPVVHEWAVLSRRELPTIEFARILHAEFSVATLNVMIGRLERPPRASRS